VEAREELKLKLQEAESANLEQAFQTQVAVLGERSEQLKATQMQVAERVEEKESLEKAFEKQAQDLQARLDESQAEKSALQLDAQAKQHQAELEISKLTASLETERETGKRLQGLVDATEAKLANETLTHAATSRDLEEASQAGSSSAE